MNWPNDVSYFFGSMLLTNAVPHLVNGLMGRPFQSPFARPPGEGLSSSVVNVIWGFANIGVGYVLVCRVGNFDLHNWEHVIAASLGAVAIGLALARHFGRFNGGNI